MPDGGWRLPDSGWWLALGQPPPAYVAVVKDVRDLNKMGALTRSLGMYLLGGGGVIAAEWICREEREEKGGGDSLVSTAWAH